MRRGQDKLKKIVVKTAVITVAIIIVVVSVVFTIFRFAFPQHMATLSEGMGNYNLAVRCASLRYSYTHDCNDLARCFDDSVLWKNDQYIIQYGEELVNNEGFFAVCESKNQAAGANYDYRQRVFGKIAVSYYNTGKKGKAVSFASEANGYTSFVYGNALMSLAAAVRSASDKEVCALIVAELDKIQPANGQELTILNEVKNSLRAIIAAYDS